MRSLLKGLILLCILFNFSNLFSVDEKDDFVYDLSLATQGVSVSQYNTGVNYSIGRGITKDLEKAIYWYQRASEQGHSKAPFNIAIFYSDGVYVDPDPELALNYFLIAEERGNLSAKKFLDALRLNKDIRMQDALVELCCPAPLSHSMIKN